MSPSPHTHSFQLKLQLSGFVLFSSHVQWLLGGDLRFHGAQLSCALPQLTSLRPTHSRSLLMMHFICTSRRLLMIATRADFIHENFASSSALTRRARHAALHKFAAALCDNYRELTGCAWAPTERHEIVERERRKLFHFVTAARSSLARRSPWISPR